MKIRVQKRNPLKVRKETLYKVSFTTAVALSFFNSLRPWVLWEVERLVQGMVILLFLFSYLMYKAINPGFRPSPRLLAQGGTIFLLMMFNFFAQGSNIAGLFLVTLQVVTVFCAFAAPPKYLKHSLEVVSKIMAVLLAVTMAAFLMYIMGRGVQTCVAVDYNEYSFLNYRWFLIPEVEMWTIIPRFQSIFLEPSHMAIACVFLLMTDIGNWKKWYNAILVLSVAVSFSLEGYVLLVCLFFMGRWIMRRHFVRGIIFLASVFVGIVAGSFVYNDGVNMVNTLIVSRLEVDDGEVAGNNRTTESFDAEFDSYLTSSDVLLGRGEVSDDFGNSGYKVYIYVYGFISTFILFVFYVTLLYHPRNKRPAFTAFVLSAIHFIVRAHMLWSSCYIPMLYTAQYLSQVKASDSENQ